MKLIAKSIHLFIAAGLLCQCTPLHMRNLSKSQRGQLGSVAIPNGTMEAKACEAPQCITLESAQTIGFVSGLTLGLVGGAIAAAGVNAKQKSFEGKNQTDIAKIEAGTPKDLATLVTSELKAKLKSDPFFGPKLTDKAAGAQLTVKIAKATLLKVPSDRGYSPSVFATATLTDAAGTNLLARFVMADGYGFNKKASTTDAIAPLSSYASNPALLRQHYLKVASVAANYLATELAHAAKD